jgi:glycosyltransferase involved in cell wall biosynthesis
MARILYINYETTLSGATVHRDRLHEHLKGLGAEVTLRSKPSKVEGGRQRPGWSLDGLKRWLYLRHTDWALLLMLGRNLPRELSAFLKARPHVLLLNYTGYLSSLLLARLLGIPVVLQIHAPPSLHCEYAGLPLRWSRFWEAVEQWALALADGVVVVSRPLMEYYAARGVPESKLLVVPNGVDLSRFRPELNPSRVIARYDLQGMTVVGYVGILDQWLRIDRLIEMVPALSADHPSLRLLIVGDGPMRAELQALVGRRGLGDRVILTGFVPHEEIPEHLAAMDVTVAPYRRVEVFYNSPMKVVEYMAMGKPVVAPRMGEIPDLIRDGENGLLYPPDDDRQMAAKIRALLESPSLRTGLGRQASETMGARKWTWAANAGAILGVCQSVAGRQREAWLSR